uniref:Uncharacterized protein n=1 Tax=Ascaris lumbricoides TaxID=6252 RepID=A0A0M3I6U7_ASCLU
MVGEQLGCWQRRCTCCAKRRETQGASIAVQQGSTTQQTTSSSRHKQASVSLKNLTAKLPASSVPPVLKPRLNDGLFCVAVFALLKHALGFLFTLFVVCVLITCVPVVLLARFVRCARSRFAHKFFAPHNHCDAWWPLQGKIPFRAVITTQSVLDQNLLSSQLTRVFVDQETTTRCGCDAYRDIERSEPTPEVRVWDQQRTRLKVVGELMRVLNDPSSIHAQSQSPSSVLLVPDFTNVAHTESCCCLAIFSHDCYSFTFCLPRLLSLYTNGQLIFDMEPKMGESFSPQRAEFNVMLKLCHIMAQTIQFTCVGPLSVAAMCLRRENPIWRELINESGIASLNRRKNEAVDGDETILMESIDGEKKGEKSYFGNYSFIKVEMLKDAGKIFLT